jgi:ubiquinone biosynthesis protein
MREEKVSLSTPERVVKVLQDLGPTFVKIGQVLSTRIDMLPQEYIKELVKLQDDVPPLREKEVKEVLEAEFGKKTEAVFPRFHWQPLAAASIGQVHRGVLPTGEEVVIKVQRPGIKELMEIDLEILFDLARFLDKRTAWGKQYGLLEVVEELSNSLRGEMDYSLEGRNSEKIRNNFKDNQEVLVPKVYWEYTTSRILVLEYIESVKILNIEELKKRNWNVNQIASKFVSAMITQIFVHGFFHADPHPGNVGVWEEKIVLMDFGQVGKIDEWAMNKYIDLIIYLIKQDVTGVVNVLLEFGVVDEQVERKKLERDISRLKQKYYRVALSEINVGLALQEMLKVIQDHNVKLPAEFVLMIKALLTVEGVVQQLNPQLSIVEIAEPLGVELFKKKYNLQNISKHLLQQVYENLKLMTELPKQINSLFSALEEGRLKLRVEHSNLRNVIVGLNIASNRIAISIVLASIIVGSSLIAQRFERSILLKVPIAEIGFLLAVILGIWLVFSILRKGKY